MSAAAAPLKKPPSLRNNNGSLQVRVRIDGKDAFINRLGRWSDPVAVARHTPSPPKSGATGGFQVKTITIRLSDVEAAMLIEVRKNDKGFRDLNELLRELIHREFFKSPFVSKMDVVCLGSSKMAY